MENYRKINSPIRWLGGKGRLTKKILKLIPPHQTYVEAFGGGASLLFAKRPSPIEIYNDLDSGLVNFFRVLRDPEKFQRFFRLVFLTPYSREEYCFCYDTWKQCEDDVEMAYRWFVIARMSFNGKFESGWNVGVLYDCASSWLSTIKNLPQIHSRIMKVQIEHRDFRELLPIYDTPKTLFYLDPPYIPETRKRAKYRYEMSANDHKELVNMLLLIKGIVILSGYKHPIYEPLEQAGWKRYDYETVCHITGRKGKGSRKINDKRVESIWISPNCKKQATLSDLLD